MGKKVIIIIVALLLVAAGVLVYFFVIAPKAKEAVEVYYNTGEPYIANVIGTEDTLFKTNCQLLICREETETLTPKNAKVRDCVLRVLRSFTEEQLRSPDAQDMLSDAICEKLNREFAEFNVNKKGEALPPLFTKALFTEMIMQ